MIVNSLRLLLVDKQEESFSRIKQLRGKYLCQSSNLSSLGI